MKNKILIVCFALFTFAVLAGCKQVDANNDYLRIHIRANSNQENDQLIKYQIKDLVIDHLTPFLTKCDNKQDVVNALLDNKIVLENKIDSYLTSENFAYTSEVVIDNEFFPTRYYGDYLLPADYYDAIIINLGEGVGNNWWCVVYPPLCFSNSHNIVYKSKIKEIIDRFFKGV